MSSYYVYKSSVNVHLIIDDIFDSENVNLEKMPLENLEQAISNLAYKIEQQGTDGDMHWIKLIPKSQDSTFKSVLIGLEKGNLSGMQLNDNFGQLTRIYFSNLKLNQPIKPELFEFKAPAGADVFAE